MITTLVVIGVVLLIGIAWSFWPDPRANKIYTVIYDGSIFTHEHLVEIKGWQAAKSFVWNWVYEHPHGMARIFDGSPFRGTGNVNMEKPQHWCGVEACKACGRMEERRLIDTPKKG